MTLNSQNKFKSFSVLLQFSTVVHISSE